jgi:hypothetical protein
MELIVGVVVVAVAGSATAGMVFGRGRRKERRLELAAQLERLAAEAGSALVRTDERVRLAEDELGFAVAQLGEREAQDLAEALQQARAALAEAFRLNQLLHDHVPDADAQRYEWNARIVDLCRAADATVSEQTAALAERRATVRRTPTAIEQVRADAERVRGLVPEARATLEALVDRYTDAALQPVAANPDQAERLLQFAERSATVAGKKLAGDRGRDADAAVQAAVETVRRAEGLLEAVEQFEMEALRAEATLGAMIAESRNELAAARAMPAAARGGRIDAAIAGLEQALAELPAPGERTDPIGSLTRVRQANTALDDAVDAYREAGRRAEQVRAQLATALDDAHRQVAAARQVVDDYRAPVGPDARTRLAEAERELAEASAERDPERALGRARRAASLAAEARALAHRDLAQQQGGYGYGGGYGWQGAPRGRSGAGDMLGGILGGLVIGGILDDIGDIGDMFD